MGCECEFMEANCVDALNNQFNLIDDPWIRVRLVGSRCGYMMTGLSKLFSQAKTIEDIDTGNPMSDLAVLRLALAIAHASMADEAAAAQASNDSDNAFRAIRDRLFAVSRQQPSTRKCMGRWPYQMRPLPW